MSRVTGHGLSELEPYLAARVRQPYPDSAFVLEGSTPVVSFGDVRSAWVATLGLNPSDSEFVEDGTWLVGDRQRFESLDTLGLARPEDADDDQVLRILDACYGYFDGPNPFWRWFRPLDRVLTDALGASYSDGSGVHLDLVQWATAPVWNKIPSRGVRRRLIERDREFLRQQLAQESIRLVLMNGRRVMREVEQLGVQLEPEPLTLTAKSTFEMMTGTLDGTVFVGWNLTFPNGGISHARREQIVQVVADLGAPLRPPANAEEGTVTSIPKDTTVNTKEELVTLLRDWLSTGEKTLGDVGSFGGKPWVGIQRGETEIVLNADTKRAAVQEYLSYVAENGADSPWPVVANQRGTVNKVVFRAEGVATPGWYAYTTKSLPSPTAI